MNNRDYINNGPIASSFPLDASQIRIGSLCRRFNSFSQVDESDTPGMQNMNIFCHNSSKDAKVIEAST